MDNFDLRKYLAENKLTNQSKLISEEFLFINSDGDQVFKDEKGLYYFDDYKGEKLYYHPDYPPKKMNLKRKYLAEGRLLKEDKPAGYYNAATITSHSDYYDIIITNKEEFFKIQKDPDSFMGEEAEEYLIDLEPGMYQMIYWNDEGPDSMSFNTKEEFVKESIYNYWGEEGFIENFEGLEDELEALYDEDNPDVYWNAFGKHMNDNLDTYYEMIKGMINNSFPDGDSASGVVLLVNGKEVAGADNGRLTNMF